MYGFLVEGVVSCSLHLLPFRDELGVGEGEELSFSLFSDVWLFQPVRRSRVIVRMRPRPGEDERETVERLCRERVHVDAVESLRDDGEMDVDVAVDMSSRFKWPQERPKAKRKVVTSRSGNGKVQEQ